MLPHLDVDKYKEFASRSIIYASCISISMKWISSMWLNMEIIQYRMKGVIDHHVCLYVQLQGSEVQGLKDHVQHKLLH